MYAQYENHYLDDQAVANFARHSFAKLAENFTPEQNHSLIRFLARGMTSSDWDTTIRMMLSTRTREGAHELAVYMRSIPEHWVPFGHPQITLRMEAPVPIRTQCFKHKIGFVESEESRRYISSRPVLYVPDAFRSAAASVKQGSGGIHDRSSGWIDAYVRKGQECIDMYETMIGDGIAPEQARFILPQGCEVHWVWTGSLYAYANAFNARTESHAQKESQGLFTEIGDIIAPLFPVSWAALTQGQY